MALDPKALEAAQAAVEAKMGTTPGALRMAFWEVAEVAILSYLQHAGEGEPVAWRWKAYGHEDGPWVTTHDGATAGAAIALFGSKGLPQRVEPLYSRPTLTTDTPVAGDGWQDIAIAAKDGTRILLTPGRDRFVSVEEAHWKGERNGWRAAADNWPIRNPTHWRPLPAAPQKGGE